MLEPEGLNNPSDVPTDSASAPPSEPGPSTSAVQAPGAQASLPTGVAPQASAAQPGKTVLGLRQDTNHYRPPQNVVFADDYEKRLPEDPYGEETAPNARIWRVYNEEAAAYDAVFVGQARDGLDVMLVFAGLFSAVVTSFLVQVSQSLQADYTAMSAILLYDLVSVQLSITDGSSSRPNITAPSINPLQTFRPDSITVWVNGLWVVSLAMSLVVALSAVLVKQWFHHYTSIPSGTPGACSHLRQYRFDGLQKWRVTIIIGILPIIMHISLALFLTGLMLSFIPLRTSLAFAVGVITVVLCLLYLASSALPIFFPQCPYQTPLTDFIYHTGLAIKNASHSLLGYIQCQVVGRIVATCHEYWIYRRLPSKSSRDSGPLPYEARAKPDPTSATLSALEMVAVTSNYAERSVDALDWLFSHSSNPTVHSLAVQAIGGLPLDVLKDACTNWYNRNEIRDVLKHCFGALEDSPRRVIECDSVRERLIRSRYFFACGQWPYYSTILNQVCKTKFDEPRFTATAWAATFGNRFQPSRELRKFFCTYSELELHPFIWERVTRSALESESHCFRVNSLNDLSDPDYAHIIVLFLPASKPHEFSRLIKGHSYTVTLHVALTFYVGDISKSVQDRLLDMLSSFEDDLPVMLPPHYQILYKAAKFALHLVLHYLPDESWASYRDGGSCRYLELLSTVLGSLSDEYNTILVNHSGFLAPILKLLCTIIDETSLCTGSYTAAGLQHSTLQDLLGKPLLALNGLFKQLLSSCQPDFVFPSFHRLVQVLPHYLSEWQGPHPPPLQDNTFDLMSIALETGTEGMYQAFIDGEWLWMLAERYIAYRTFIPAPIFGLEPIFGFIRGLQALDPRSALEFLDYFQQPRNFIVTVIMLAPDFPDTVTNKHLLTLCPKDSSLWNTHRATLDGLIDWCEASNCDYLPFPLENLFNGKVVQTDDGAVSLDETLRKMFARGWYRRSVERAARTIILGEPAPERPPRYLLENLGRTCSIRKISI